MKIIIVGPAWPYRGGIATHNNRLARQLLAEGHQVKVYTFTLQYPKLLFPGKTQFSSDPAPEGVEIVRTLSSINPFSWTRTARLIAAEKPDAVMLRFWMPYFAPCLGRLGRYLRRRGIKVVSLVDNIIPHEHKPGDKAFARYFVKSVDGFLVMSQSVIDELKAFDASKPVAFAPHPLYDHYGSKESKADAAAALGLDPTVDYFLFFGLIRDYKGLDLLLDAMACDDLRDSKAQLIVAGEFYGDSAKYYEKERYLGLKGRIHWFPEFIPDDKVRHFFNVADLVVQPYRTATQSGITQIAYHFEKPMIVTRVGGLAEIVPDGKCGYVVDPVPSAIAIAIAEFYANRPDFSQGIAEQKQQFSWSRLTAALTDLIKQI
ncbi:MAG: glycosyltransferase [Bacteroidales bacterium]|nr:glycosyltransferase [Bacteroidales bacterium]